MRNTLRRRKASRGYALITVLWMGLGLLLGAAAFLADSRQSALGVRAEIEASRAVDLARSGINVALADLGRIDDDQRKSRRDGSPVVLRMAEGQVTYRIQDENGKISVSEAPVELLRPALEYVGSRAGVDAFAASNIAEAIVAGRSDGRRAATLSQILADAGLDARSARAAGEVLSSFNFAPQINPRNAPEAVLAVIPGMGPSDVADVIARRETGQPMPRLGTAAVWLVEREGPVFTIDAEAILTGGARARMTVQVAQRGLGFRGGQMRYHVLDARIER